MHDHKLECADGTVMWFTSWRAAFRAALDNHTRGRREIFEVRGDGELHLVHTLL